MLFFVFIFRIKFTEMKGVSLMKTLKELLALKDEYKTLLAKLSELTEEELYQVTGGNPFIGLFVPPKKDTDSSQK